MPRTNKHKRPKTAITSKVKRQKPVPAVNVDGTKKVGARPKHVFTQDDYNEIRNLMAIGCTKQSIARHFGYSPARFYELIQMNKDLEDALYFAKEDFSTLLCSKVNKIALDDYNPKQLQALTLLLKSHYGWTELEKKNNPDNQPTTINVQFVDNKDQ